MDTDRLRMKVFPLSPADDAKQWWIDEWNGKITTWGYLLEDSSCVMSFLGIWMGIDESSDDIISSDDEWEEYDYGNPLDTTTDS
ncbi:hypothetical protein Tco_0555736, partial [Tanacetum coccineum]